MAGNGLGDDGPGDQRACAVKVRRRPPASWDLAGGRPDLPPFESAFVERTDSNGLVQCRLATRRCVSPIPMADLRATLVVVAASPPRESIA